MEGREGGREGGGKRKESGREGKERRRENPRTRKSFGGKKVHEILRIQKKRWKMKLRKLLRK